MNGFKPTGFGPKAGFHFPTKMGFTGSTGNITHVSPYVRRKGFASGGFVRQDNPRMTVADVGDPGSAMVRRTRPFSEQEREAGGRSPLRPGFKDGGRNWIAGATKNKGALHRALGVPEGKKIPAKKMAKAAKSDNPTMRRRAALAKTLGKMHKADGGKVEPPKPTLTDRIKEALGLMASNSNGLAKKAADKISGRQKQIDDAVDSAQTGRPNYARGGKIKASRFAKGGMADEAQDKKMIGAALKKHVNTPAPKGHKGLGAMCK